MAYKRGFEPQRWVEKARYVLRQAREGMASVQIALHRVAGVVVRDSREWGSPRHTVDTFEEAVAQCHLQAPRLAEQTLSYLMEGLSTARQSSLARETALARNIAPGDYARHRESVAVLRPGRLFSECARPVVIAPNDAAVIEGSHWADDGANDRSGSPAHRRMRLPAVETVSGRALLLGRGGSNYYHFLIDTLCQMRLAELADMPMASFDHFLIPEPLHAYAEQILIQRMGLNPNRFSVFANRHLEIEELVIPTVHDRAGTWYVDYLRGLLPPTNRSPSGRLYISRNGARIRRVANEAEVTAELTECYGFRIVASEKLTLQEQVDLFANAEVIVAPHGAGLANILFCAPETTVVEIRAKEHRNHTSECFAALAKDSGLRYRCVLADGESSDRHGWETCDVRVDIGALRACLDDYV